MPYDMYSGLVEALFSEDLDEGIFHDTVFDATGQSLAHNDLISVFKTLPEEVQKTAVLWSLSDTDFNEMALKFLKEKNGA
jgi:hypothetical protein